MRAARRGRTEPWTAEELLALDVAHRLDRYAGRYGLPIVSIELAIERRADKLVMGVSGRGGMRSSRRAATAPSPAEDPEGGAIVLEFDEDEAGAVSGVDMVRGGGERIPWRAG